jgi:hypothetical protein
MLILDMVARSFAGNDPAIRAQTADEIAGFLVAI